MNIQTPRAFKEALLKEEEEKRLRKRQALEGLLELSRQIPAKDKMTHEEIVALIKEGRRY